MDIKMYCTLIRQSIYYITISCSFLCLRGKRNYGTVGKITCHMWVRPDLCSHYQKKPVLKVILWFPGSVFSPDFNAEHFWWVHLTHMWKQFKKKKKIKKSPFRKCPWRRHWMWKCCQRGVSWAKESEKRANKKKAGLFLSCKHSKRVHLQQHVYLRHKLKLCHVLNRCSGTQRILCLWHECTDRMKYAESGV